MPEIEDRPDNTTRFLVIGRKAVTPSGPTRPRSSFRRPRPTPGALYRLLEPLADHGISMTRIESRPSRRGKWDYVFFIDIEGHAETEPLATALAELKRRASLFRVVGAYPKAIL